MATREIRPRNADRVIAAGIDHHVGPRRHVAVGALRAGRVRLDDGDGTSVSNFAGRWHWPHTALPSRPQLQAVRVVAVRTGDARLEHAALQERAVFVDLVEDLAVGMIEAGIEQVGHVGIEERMAVAVGSTRSRAGAHGSARRSPPRRSIAAARCAVAVAGAGSSSHMPAAGIAEADRQSMGGIRRAALSGAFAQATWREPGPWQASQETSISDQVV